MSRKVAELQGPRWRRAGLRAPRRGPDVPEAAHRAVPRARARWRFASVVRYEPGRWSSRTSVSRCPPGRASALPAAPARKTTLLSLLMRFYDPVAGDIRLDGIDLPRSRLADLRNQFAWSCRSGAFLDEHRREHCLRRPDRHAGCGRARHARRTPTTSSPVARRLRHAGGRTRAALSAASASAFHSPAPS